MTTDASRARWHERRIKTCRHEQCKARIVFLRSRTGSKVPVDADGVTADHTDYDPKLGHVSHFATCPGAAGFRRPR